MFADDLATVIAGNIGSQFTKQCFDLKRKLKIFIDNLEYFAILSVQRINFSKTEAVWSARAIGPPKFEVTLVDIKIKWVDEFKYLRYRITPNLQ